MLFFLFAQCRVCDCVYMGGWVVGGCGLTSAVMAVLCRSALWISEGDGLVDQ